MTWISPHSVLSDRDTQRNQTLDTPGYSQCGVRLECHRNKTLVTPWIPIYIINGGQIKSNLQTVSDPMAYLKWCILRFMPSFRKVVRENQLML